MEINVTPDDSAGVVEATDQDFEAKVIEKSNQVPVLVDFWAPWCGPCKTIGPILEKLAAESNGRFDLVKVNMDESPMLAQALRIQSIPAVKLFINGAIQDEFMGAYPEAEIVSFLEKNLPTEGVGDAVLGLQLLQSGNTAAAMKIFEQVLAEEPQNPIAQIGMGHILLDQGDIEGAREKAYGVNEVELEKLSDRQKMEKLLSALKGRIFLNENMDAKEESPGELASKFSQACQGALQGNYEAALETLLSIVKSDRKFKKDGGRLGMLAIFDILPLNSPLTADYRQKLSSILFS
jgi:putative thioredoxin